MLYCPVTCGWPPLLERVQSLPVNRVSRLLVLELVSLPNRCSGRALAGMFARQVGTMSCVHARPGRAAPCWGAVALCEPAQERCRARGSLGGVRVEGTC